MASFFSAIFACCLRSGSKSPERPDETTHLIPAAEESSPTPQRHVVVVDHQRLKERLGTIVRSKEGKMVNVSAQIPFNLHNAPPAAATRTSSIFNSTSSKSPRYPSPQPSVDSSGPSQHEADQDRGDPHSGLDISVELENEFNKPTLGVRLASARGAKMYGGVGMTRGRTGSRSRLGRFGEERRARAERERGRERRPNGVEEDGDESREDAIENGQEEPDSQHLQAPSTISTSGLNFQNVGDIARSWGD